MRVAAVKQVPQILPSGQVAPGSAGAAAAAGAVDGPGGAGSPADGVARDESSGLSVVIVDDAGPAGTDGAVQFDDVGGAGGAGLAGADVGGGDGDEVLGSAGEDVADRGDHLQCDPFGSSG